MERKLKTWQGWLLFAGTMVVVFVLGLVVASMLEHRAEVASVFNNKKVDIKGIEPRNEIFKIIIPENMPRGCVLQRLTLKASSTAAKLLMCWLNDRKWSFYGPDMLFLKTTQRLADTCMPLRMCIARSVPVHLLVIMMVRNRLPAGLAKVRTYHG